MMYSVSDPFRLDQGDVSFDAPDTVKSAMTRRDRREPSRITCRRPACRGCASCIAAKLRDRNGIPIDDRRGRPGHEWGHSRALHGLSARCSNRVTKCIVPDPAWPPAAGNILVAARRADWRVRFTKRAAGGTISTKLESKITLEDACPVPELAEQPDRRSPDAERSRAAGRDRARPRPVGDLGRGVRGRRLRRRARQHRVAAGHVRAHDSALHVQQVVRDDRARLGYVAIKDAKLRDRPKKIAVLHLEQHRVGRAVRRDRRARRAAGLHRDVPRGAAGAAGPFLQRVRAKWPATLLGEAARRRVLRLRPRSIQAGATVVAGPVER